MLIQLHVLVKMIINIIIIIITIIIIIIIYSSGLDRDKLYTIFSVNVNSPLTLILTKSLC